MTNIPDVNRQSDYDRLLNLPALTQWTLDRQSEHATDRTVYEAALASFQAHLRSQHVEGDRRWSAVLRARRVEKYLKDLVKASRKAEAAAEGLRNTYAGHVAHVAALPAQREAKALRKAGGRQAVAQIAAKSLHKSAAAAAGPAKESLQAPADGPRGLGDLWKQQKGA